MTMLVAMPMPMIMMMTVAMTMLMIMFVLVLMTVVMTMAMAMLVSMAVIFMIVFKMTEEIIHIVVMVLMRIVENHVEIAYPDRSFLYAGYFYMETFDGNAIERRKQLLLIDTQIEHRTNEHIAADSCRTFKVERSSHIKPLSFLCRLHPVPIPAFTASVDHSFRYAAHLICGLRSTINDFGNAHENTSVHIGFRIPQAYEWFYAQSMRSIFTANASPYNTIE